ncbi:hypothetical protein HDU81_001794, partial [Chytriomyces hyalinus]
MGRLDTKVGLITGAGRLAATTTTTILTQQQLTKRSHPSISGIGFETAMLFAKEGAKVVACDVNANALTKAVEKINKAYPESAIAVTVDVSNEMQVKAAFDEGERVFGKINVVFNNAGIMHGADDNAESTPENIWDLTFNINVKG